MQIGMLPEHALRGTSAARLASHPFNLSPIGTGPYQLEALRSTSSNRTDIIDLRAAPVYRQRPEGQAGYAVDRISFRLYGTFDEAMGD
jgi:ABC-type transport system substrate-binding protein